MFGAGLYLLCRIAPRGRFDPLLRNAYIIAAVLFGLDAHLLRVLRHLPYVKPEPLFADEPEASQLRDPLLPLVGIVIGLSVTTAVARQSSPSLKKCLVILAMASLALLAVTTFFFKGPGAGPGHPCH